MRRLGRLDVAVELRRPAGDPLPRLETTFLPQLHTVHLLEEEEIPIFVGQRDGAVAAGRAELSAVEDLRIDLDLAQRVVEEFRLGTTGPLIERGAAQVLHEDPRLAAVGEPD